MIVNRYGVLYLYYCWWPYWILLNWISAGIIINAEKRIPNNRLMTHRNFMLDRRPTSLNSYAQHPRRNLPTRQPFGIHRNNYQNHRGQHHNKPNLKSGQNYYPPWTMLDVVLSKLPEIGEVHFEINDIHSNHHDNDLNQPGDLLDVNSNDPLRTSVVTVIDQLKKDFNSKSSNVPNQSPNQFGKISPQVKQDDGNAKHLSIDVEDYSFSSGESRPPIPKVPPKPINVNAVHYNPMKPFWGLPISQSSPNHFMFPNKGKNPITTSSTTTEKPFKENAEEFLEEEEEEDSDKEEYSYSTPLPKETDKHFKSRIDYDVHPVQASSHLPVYQQSVQPMQRVDFGPIFLALIPIALVLGAAASLALTSAVRPNQAVAMAQQQQQQSENSNSNNNQNSNSALLESLALVQSLHSEPQYPPFIIVVNGTAQGRRRRKKK